MDAIRLTSTELTVAYGQAIALDSVSFGLQGKIIAIIGHNGSGKSTLMKTFLRLLPIRAGNFSVSKLGIELIPELDMAFSPEHGAVFADIKVESYVKLWCRIRRHDANCYKTVGREYLERLEIAPLLPKLGRALSKGQRQRVQTFVGFLLNPRLFVFDEPFDGLDVMQTRKFSQLMSEESSERSIILSSHRMDVVERLADQIIVLREGRCFAAGSLDEVKRALAGDAVSVVVPELSEDALSALRLSLAQFFPHLLVSRIGREIVVLGHNAHIGEIQLRLQGEGVRLAAVQQAEPSLVDAMDYHLRTINRPSVEREIEA